MGANRLKDVSRAMIGPLRYGNNGDAKAMNKEGYNSSSDSLK